MRVFLVAFALLTVACGAGVPVELRVDQFAFEVPLDDVIDAGFSDLVSQGFLPPGTQAFPAVWPDELPDIQYRTNLKSDPVPVGFERE